MLIENFDPSRRSPTETTKVLLKISVSGVTESSELTKYQSIPIPVESRDGETTHDTVP